ncbi:MAG: hypothetical protein ROO73_02900 [Roseivirga sp.]
MPEVFEAVGAEVGIDNGVADVGVPHVGLYGTGVDGVVAVGKVEACAVSA